MMHFARTGGAGPADFCMDAARQLPPSPSVQVPRDNPPPTQRKKPLKLREMDFLKPIPQFKLFSRLPYRP